jgi:hypothetical protein
LAKAGFPRPKSDLSDFGDFYDDQVGQARLDAGMSGDKAEHAFFLKML